MKKMMALLLILSCALSIAACGGKDRGEVQGASASAKDWGITLTAKDVTPTGLTLVCTQSGGIAEGELSTGSAFWIEREDDGVWSAVPTQVEDIMWDAMAYLVVRDGTTEWTVDWSYLYGELPAGAYRICKEIMDFKAPGENEQSTYCAEFNIE